MKHITVVWVLRPKSPLTQIVQCARGAGEGARCGGAGPALGDAAVSAACWASAVGAAACTAPGMPALTSELRAWIRDAASELEEGAADRRVARVAGLGGA